MTELSEQNQIRQEHRFKLALLLICLFALTAYLLRAANFDVFTRAESCFSESAKEMLLSGNYVIPKFYGAAFFDKPILTYWLIIISYKIFGISIFTARIPSTVSAVTLIASLGIFARMTYGRIAGIASAAALASSMGFFDMATSSMSDMLLSLFDFVCLALFFAGFKSERFRTWLFLACAISMSLGFLTKGIPALVLPCLSIIVFLAVCKQLHIIKLKHLLFGLLALALIAVPWHVALYRTCGLTAFKWMYVRETLERFAGTVSWYNFGHPFFYMTFCLISNLFPWSLFLPFFFVGAIRDWKEKFVSTKTQCSLLMLIWICAHLLIFSMSRSNWGYYNLPAYPAVCLLAGAFYSFNFFSQSTQALRWKMIALASVLLIMTAASLATSFESYRVKEGKEAHNVFSRILAQTSDSAPFIEHNDLLGQYRFSDLIIFRTRRQLLLSDQKTLTRQLCSSQPYYAALPATRFAQLPADLKNRLSIVSSGKFKYVEFPQCKFNTNDRRVELVLVRNNPDHPAKHWL